MRRDLIWLSAVLGLVVAAVTCTPIEVSIPCGLVQSTPEPAYSPTPTSDSFSFYCTGLRHYGAPSKFHTPASTYPPYKAESGLLDHP